MFCAATIALIELVTGMHYLSYGDLPASSDEGALIICNHPTEWDWLYLWGFLTKYSHLPNLKIVMKDPIRFFPFFGWSVQACQYLFLTRKWADDREHVLSIMEYWRRYGPAGRQSLLIFPEGTNIGKHSLAKAEAFSKAQGLPLMREALPPRSTGFAELFLGLTGLREVEAGADLELARYSPAQSRVAAVYNMTIAYSRSRSNAEMFMARGRFPYSVHVLCERIPVQTLVRTFAADTPAPEPSAPATVLPEAELPPLPASVPLAAFEARVAAWLTAVFYAKDHRLTRFYADARIDDVHAPPLLHDAVIWPHPAARDGTRRDDAPVGSWNLFSPSNTFVFEFWSLVAMLVTAAFAWGRLLTGDALAWAYLAVVGTVSYYFLNVKKISLPKAYIAAAERHEARLTHTKQE
jgi:hypothetical protein